jgi:hypothetical protein
MKLFTKDENVETHYCLKNVLFQSLELLYDQKTYSSQNHLIVSSPIEVDEN